MTAPIMLGEIATPSGLLMVVDPGLGRFWRHDGDPRSPRRQDGDAVDLGLVGPDAEAAGRAYQRQFDPRYLFDIPVDRVEEWREHFAAFAAERGLNAGAEPLDRRVPHTERARRAVAVGNGLGVVTFNGRWAVVCGGLPMDRVLPVVATPMPDGEFGGRWRSIDVVVHPQAEVARTEVVQGVMVEHGQSMYVDLDALGAFRMWESLDGLGDFVFWGADAGQVAESTGAPRIDDGSYGWTDRPMSEVDVLAESTQRLIRERELRVAVDYRPHDHLERLNAQVRVNESRAGALSLAGVPVCGFDNRWGDGIFTVARDLGPAGELLRVRLAVGDDVTQRRMRRVWSLAGGAVVSRLVWDDGEWPRFLERTATTRPNDSGWSVFSGAESKEYLGEAANFRIVALRQLVERYPAIDAVIDAPDGSMLHWEDGEYLPD